MERRSALLGSRFFGEYDEVVENLLRERFIFQEIAVTVGHDEFIGLTAVRDAVARAGFFIFNDGHDFVFVLLAVVGFDDEDVLKLELSVARLRIAVVAIDGALPVRCFVA